MRRVFAGRRARCVLPTLARLLAVWVVLTWVAPVASALEAAEGRIQLHGFVEAQVRGISQNYSDEFDLVQWYNVLNLELELDLFPDGIGPMDLLEAYVRIEARYDCVWTRGCGTMRSANTFGDRAKYLPGRLRDAEDPDYSGVIPPTPPNGPVKRIQNKRPAPINPLTGVADTDGIFGIRGQLYTPDRQGFPGFDTLFEQAGADNILGTSDDPARYTLEPVLDYRFALLDVHKAAAGTGATFPVGPWDPKSFIQSNALLIEKANPFRQGLASAGGYRGLDPLDPAVAQVKSDVFQANSEGVFLGVDGDVPIFPTVPSLVNTRPDDVTGDSFAGDYNGILPCVDPTDDGPTGAATKQKNGTEANRGCIPNIPRSPVTGEFLSIPNGGVVENGVNIRLSPVVVDQGLRNINAGISELPLRPAPDLSNLTSLDPDYLAFENFDQLSDSEQNATVIWLNQRGVGVTKEQLQNLTDAQAAALRTELGFSGNNSRRLYAQGLYVPSMGLRRELAKGLDPTTGVPLFDAKKGKPIYGDKLDSLDFNYRQAERAWNRGQSQQDTKELKEAYLDIEWLDSRLWTRIGLQNIVWGKTELFRTTDQFNPQDLALASLPSLEESRIALWAARFVYSLYQVGPLEDVRVEFAFNFDNYQPADLGAAGEPFTPDVVGGLTTGLFFHSFTGVGVAGIDRPPNPWDSIKGLEVGGRVEWRWDRFSFALSDFYGYNDFPYIDRIFSYERNVAYATGRPLIAEVSGTSDCATPSAGTSVNPGEAGFLDGTAPDRPYNDPKNPQSMTVSGLGIEVNCLKAGGAPNFENENEFGGAQNALAFHHANQEIFAWACSATIAIAAVLDPGACAFNIFGSGAPLLVDPVLKLPSFVEVISSTAAGEIGSGNQSFLRTITNNTKTGTTDNPNTEFSAVNLTYPLASLNFDPGPSTPGDTGWDGVITAAHPNINAQNPVSYSVLIEQTFFQGNPLGPSNYIPAGSGGNPNLDCDGNIDRNEGPRQLLSDLLGNFTEQNQRITINGGVCSQFRFHHDPTDFVTLDSTLSNAQRALLGCGPYYGTRCDSADEVFILPAATYPTAAAAQAAVTQLYPAGGGIDFLNMEGNVFVQSWPGFEGTAPLGDAAKADVFWTTLGQKAQPGTVNYDGGPICTRPQGSGKDLELVTLPGCRGIATIEALDIGTPSKRVEVTFDAGYLPSVDGCLVQANFDDGTLSGVPTVYPGVEPGSRLADELEACATYSEHKEGAYNVQSMFVAGATTLFHPLAGCLPDTAEEQQNFAPGTVLASQASLESDCPWRTRDLEAEFLGLGAPGRTAQVFATELAAVSYNFMLFLVGTSCNFREGDDIANDPECFNPREPLRADKCSFNAPHLCTNVKGLMGIAGVGRPEVRAGGNGRFGRRDFIWHSGGEIVLRYEKRNVFGFAMDFAEDVTKSNWGVEFTWIEGVHFINNDSFSNTSTSDTLNMTVSVDRPTFINFLNPNRTFFINSQWFFQYVTDYKDGFVSNGPFNVLFTFAVFTGYFQDRLLPTFVSVFDINSQSGAFLPSITYRFTEAFSATLGINWFFGRNERVDMPINEIGPRSNRAPNAKGKHAYQDATENLLSLVRSRDEAYLRIRWTF